MEGESKRIKHNSTSSHITLSKHMLRLILTCFLCSITRSKWMLHASLIGTHSKHKIGYPKIGMGKEKYSYAQSRLPMFDKYVEGGGNQVISGKPCPPTPYA